MLHGLRCEGTEADEATTLHDVHLKQQAHIMQYLSALRCLLCSTSMHKTLCTGRLVVFHCGDMTGVRSI